MKIQCNVCEAAEATVLCCADEAALCYACDEKVHAANKLASKHQRVSLSNSSSPMPKCDICQETVGYFFCLEDRALLCRKCDFSIHSVNTHVSAHKRFLLTGVMVGLEPIDRSAPTLCGKPKSPEKETEEESSPLCRKDESNSSGVKNNNGSFIQVPGGGDFAPTKLPFSGGSDPGSFQPWQLDEIFGLGDLNQNYNYIENGLSTADSSKLGDSDGSPILMAADFEVDGDESMGQVPEIAWAVPELLSPPTASGLYWPNSYEHHMDSATAFVPDVCHSPMQHPYHRQSTGSNLKRKRQ